MDITSKKHVIRSNIKPNFDSMFCSESKEMPYSDYSKDVKVFFLLPCDRVC